MHIECTAQSRKDFLDRGILCLDSNGLRAAANLHFREHRRRSNCHGAAKRDHSPNGEISRADGM
jgi:hypothetical protein